MRTRHPAEGELQDARAPLWNNPQVTVEGIQREIPQVSASTQVNQEWGLGIAQTPADSAEADPGRLAMQVLGGDERQAALSQRLRRGVGGVHLVQEVQRQRLPVA